MSATPSPPARSPACASGGSRRTHRSGALGQRDRRRVQRGGRDRAPAREPPRARLPRRPARDRRRLRRVERPHERARRGSRRARAARAAARLPARRQGRRAGPRRPRDGRRRRRVLRRQRDVGARRAPPARRRPSPTRRSRTSAGACGSRTRPGSNREGLYWRYELWLREQESRLGSVTGGNGSIYALKRADYVEVDPRWGHDLALPYRMVQAGRRAVYEPAALAFEKPTPTNEAEYARKVRMFEHCWEITLRGSMLRRPACRLPRLGRLASRPALRKRAPPPRAPRDEPRPRAGRLAVCAGAARPARAARGVRGPGPDRALLRLRHLGDRAGALELPPPRRPRHVGRGRRHPVNRCRRDVALAGLGLVAREPAPRRRRARVKLEDGGPVLFRQRRVGKDGRDFELLKLRSMVVGRRAQRGRVRGRPRRLAHHAGRPLPAADVDRRAAAALERRPRRHVGDRARGRRSATRSTATRSASAGGSRSGPGLTGWAQIHGRATLPWEERIELDVWYVEQPLAARRPEDPRCARRSPSSAERTRARPAAGASSDSLDSRPRRALRSRDAEPGFAPGHRAGGDVLRDRRGRDRGGAKRHRLPGDRGLRRAGGARLRAGDRAGRTAPRWHRELLHAAGVLRGRRARYRARRAARSRPSRARRAGRQRARRRRHAAASPRPRAPALARTRGPPSRGGRLLRRLPGRHEVGCDVPSRAAVDAALDGSARPRRSAPRPLRLPAPRRGVARSGARPRAARPCVDAVDGRRRRPRARGRDGHASARSSSAPPCPRGRRRGRDPRSRSLVRPPARPATTVRCSGNRIPPSRSGRVARSGSSSAPGFRRSSRSRTARRSRVSSCPSRTRRPGATTSGSGAGSRRRSALGRRSARARDHVGRRSAVHARRASPGGSRSSASPSVIPGARTERQLVALLPLAALAGVLYFATSYPTPDGDTVKGSFMLTAVPAWAACFGFAFDGLRSRVPTVLARVPRRPRAARARRRSVPVRACRSCDRARALTNGGICARRAPSSSCSSWRSSPAGSSTAPSPTSRARSS